MMAKKNLLNKNLKSLFQISLIFLICISFISAETVWIEYEEEKQYAEKDIQNAEQKVTYALNLDSKSCNYYMKVTVTPKGDIPTPILCFSPSDANCRDNKQAISRVTNGGPAILLLKREQFYEGSDELYVLVTCKEDNCNYNIKFEGLQSLEIDTQTSYSYLVSTGNREMRFEVKGEATESDFLTIGIEGSNTAQISIDGVDKTPYTFNNGKIITFPLEPKDNDLLTIFTIKGATAGDYITLNVHLVDRANNAADNFLYPNGPVIMGMIDPSDGYYNEECFPISVMGTDQFKNVNKYYLTGRIHSKYALFYLVDERNQILVQSKQEISDGQLAYLIENEGKARTVCFEFSSEKTVKKQTVAYSISIIEPTRLESFYDFYPPQTMNEIYRRLIPKGSYAVYSSGKYEQSNQRLNFNIYNRKGVTETYVTDCSSYPYCFYNEKNLEEKDKIKIVNKMAIYDKEISKDSEALDENKKVVIVYCKDDDNDNKGYCEVESSVFTKGKEITLIENEEFSKFVTKEEKGTFKLDLKSAVEITRLSIDIMIYTGDVTFDIKNTELYLANNYKYYLSNKIHYHFNLLKKTFDSVNIDYQAKLNSFFSIKYEIDPLSSVQNVETITSGKSYLVEIDPTTFEKSKTIYLQNYRYKAGQPFLANFFALNCDFNVTRIGKEISFFDGYAQEILLENSNLYKSESYEYVIKIKEADLSNYNHKMCMLYVAGYESKDDNVETEIVVGENINQQVIFDDTFKTIRFLYPHANPENDLVIYVNIIDEGFYNLKIYTNTDKEYIRSYTITRSQMLFLPGNDIINKCGKDNLCNIIIEATFTDFIPGTVKTEPMIEITVRQILNTPSYLQKSHAKKDFTCGDKFYYLYTEIGKNEGGEVSINFLRDFGNLWGKIVRKDQVSPDEDANWRGIYRMPSDGWEDSFYFNLYTKKLEINVEDTQDCIEGCYLLLSVQVSQIGDYVNDSKFYPFTITATVSPNTQAYSDIPKVVIQVNEYIVGSVEIAENERISQFYEIWLPHDSMQVDFDWQSEVAGLYINVGGTRPTTKNADFTLLPPGRDSIFSIDKLEILQKANQRLIDIPNKDSLQDINLVIGVWTDKTDSVDTEIFSLRVHQPNLDDNLDIIEVNTDHKILCTPHYLDDNSYRCLFMITYDDEDVNLEMPLLVHATSLNQSAVTNTFASFIERESYDEYNYASLRSKIPTSQSAQYSTIDSGVDYITTKLVPGRTKYYLFVNVISDIKNDIMIITSLPMYDTLSKDSYSFYPNPSSEQLLSVSVDNLILKFFSSSLIVNIVTLSGEADLMWKNDPNTVYNLRGKGDRLSLTSGSNLEELIITNRKASAGAGEESTFVFYVSYYIRDGETNFDEILYGHSLEIGYRDTHLPVYLYSKVGASFNDLNLAVTFKDSYIDTEGEYSTSPLIIRAALAKESTVYKAKQSPELAPTFGRTIFGEYDPAIKTAQVFISEETISSYNIKATDNPTLYLSIEESNPTQKYSKFNVEAQFSKINSGIVPVEKTFNYGRYISGYFTNFYKLKIDKSKKYMIIELAFNSQYLDFCINDRMIRNNNTDYIKKAEKGRGKILITIENPKKDFIYLNFFKKENKQQNNYLLYNYVFKYINVGSENDFTDYKILEDNNVLSIDEHLDEIDKEKNIIKCTFNRIDIDKDKANITYFFKVVENSTLIEGEDYETIAVMESPYYTVYKRNPTEDKITLTAEGAFTNWAYLQVIAQIQQETILDYVAYKGVKLIRPSKKTSSDKNSSNTTLFVIIVIILIILVAGLAVVVAIIQQQNKGLVEQVKHISFQQNQNTGGADPDLLLKKN